MFPANRRLHLTSPWFAPGYERPGRAVDEKWSSSAARIEAFSRCIATAPTS